MKVTYEAGIYTVIGTREEERNFIHGEADRLKNMLEAEGFDVKCHHTGSVAGASSYINAYCPDTHVFSTELRVSGHSKGAFNTACTTNVAGDEDFRKVISHLNALRNKAKAKPGYVSLEERKEIESNENRERLARMADLKGRLDAGEQLTGKERKLVQQFEYEQKKGRI